MRRVHEVLDGERAESELTPDERTRLEEYRAAVEAGLKEVPHDPAPDATRSVMAAVRALGAPWSEAGAAAEAEEARSGPSLSERLRSAWAWLWSPRAVRVAFRPAYGVALAGLAVAVLFVSGGFLDPGPTPVDPGPGASVEHDARVLVQFRLDAPDARSVRLAGDFTDWQPVHELHEQAPGVWSVTVPLAPGVHDYAFVVDGEQWRPDPLAPQVDDGFGGHNSRLALMTPSES